MCAGGYTHTRAHLQQQDVVAFEEAIRTLLEILNRTLTHQLRTNVQLVYTMLYKRALFDSLHDQNMFTDSGHNIAAVSSAATLFAFDAQALNYFSTRIGTLGQDASVAQVMDSIEKGAMQWPSDRLKVCCVHVCDAQLARRSSPT